MSPPTSPAEEFFTYGNDHAGPVGTGSAVHAPSLDKSDLITSWIRDAHTAGHSVVRLLPGVFRIAGPIQMIDGVILEGSSPEATVLLIGVNYFCMLTTTILAGSRQGFPAR